MLNSVNEKRTVEQGKHKVVLEIPDKEYTLFYDQYSDEIAEEFLGYYLVNRGDDGRAQKVRMQHDKSEHIVRIIADIIYEGNEHTDIK